MAETQHYDIVIIGAGIAGSALALALSGHGLSIALVEAQSLDQAPLPEETGVAHFDSRVSALTPRSRALLEELGVWQNIVEQRHGPYHHMTVWDAEGTGKIDFDRAEVDACALGYIVENRVIVQALLQKLTQSATIKLYTETALASCERQAEAPLQIVLENGSRLSADLLVAADGALSKVRQLMTFATREWDYGHWAIVATVELERSHQDTAWQRFLPSGPLALLPLPSAGGRHFCSIVWSIKEAPASDLLALEDIDFMRQLHEASEGCLGEVIACSKRVGFPLRQRHAVDYVQPRVALVADAAHTIHPLAGQGINLGLQDIAVLAEEIIAGHASGVGPGELRLLKRYQRRRKGENLAMMAAMDGFKRLFEEPALSVRWLRNVGMRGVAQIPLLKQRLIRQAMGLD